MGMSRTMTLTDLGQLKRMMSVTTSTNDHEALAALRKANVVLARSNITWDELLTKMVSGAGSLGAASANDVQAGEEMTIIEQIQCAFDEIRGTVSGDFAEFVESLENQFRGTQYLTPAQRTPLFKAVMKLRERRKRDG